MSKAFELRGFVHRILPLQTFQSGFKMWTVVIVDDPEEKYPNYNAIQFVKDRVSLLDGLSEGEAVEVSFYTNAREWKNPTTGETKWFVSLNGVELKRAGGVNSPVPAPAEPPAEAVQPVSSDPDALPF